jgi:hypothetical protein
MKKLERVSGLSERILNNQGQVILTFRRLGLGADSDSEGLIPPESYHGDYFETGTINGELTKKDSGGSAEFWVHNRNFPLSYFFSSDLAVPVKNKLVWSASGSEIQRARIPFPPGHLTEAKEGDIQISSYEFLKSSQLFNELYHPQPPNLKRLEVLIGDDEIKGFVQPFLDGHRVTEESIADFLYLMKTPGEIERRVEASYVKERGKLAEELVRHVSHLNNLYDRISGMEERVLKLHRERYYEGMEDMHSWPVWSDASLVESYSGLRASANGCMGNINGLLKRGEVIGFVKHSFIKGTGIGFPGEVKTQDYLKYVNGDLMPSVQSILEKLDGHLREAQKVEV